MGLEKKKKKGVKKGQNVGIIRPSFPLALRKEQGRYAEGAVQPSERTIRRTKT